ncbi:hypothetical protein CFR76_13065 [Komagataeibacter swingsii]|uniref:Uncharacterized protein n=1 Tax=Komagataeibacter swingsii TaxID=215220 RepID=A0A2V4S187_9PROT|nr:hypothetical protein CFR76_13065 [Komagataeibacter swingsii]
MRVSDMMHPEPSGASFDHDCDDISAALPRSRLHVVTKFTVANLRRQRLFHASSKLSAAATAR